MGFSSKEAKPGKRLFIERLQRVRAGSELQSLVGMAFAHNYRFFIDVLVDVLLIWALLIMIFWLVSLAMPLPECFSSCRTLFKQDCCYFAPAILIRGALAALAVFAFSLRLTLVTEEYCLLRSALAATFLMLSLAAVSLWLGFSLSAVVLAALAVFFLVFCGYRLGMRWKG